jgi:hypothetical protein
MPKDLPPNFVRFVYCLGYGENDLLDKPITANSGTPQFWKIFYSCVNDVTSNGDFAPILKTRTDFPERAKTKMNVLDKLKAQGIWLVDASIVALYRPGQPRPSTTLYESVLLTCWENHVEAVIREARPEGILCIGLRVARTLKSRLGRLEIPWGAVPQPNARLSREKHFEIFSVYHQIAKDPNRLSDL